MSQNGRGTVLVKHYDRAGIRDAIKKYLPTVLDCSVTALSAYKTDKNGDLSYVYTYV